MTQQARLYYTNPKLLQHHTRVVSIENSALQLESTIFHPQGGGDKHIFLESSQQQTARTRRRCGGDARSRLYCLCHRCRLFLQRRQACEEFS